MSADLFEAFVGTQIPRKDLQESESKHSSGLLIQTDSPRPDDTWQSWPAFDQNKSKAPPKHQSPALWETDEDGKDVLFDAWSPDAEPDSSKNDDDFGDFEQAVTDHHMSQTVSHPTTVNLPDLHINEISSKEATGTGSPSGVVGHVNQGVPVAGKSSQIVPHEEITTLAEEQDDEWGNFETNEIPSKGDDDLSSQHDASQKATAQIERKKSSLVVAKSHEKTIASPLKLNSRPAKDDPLEEEPWDAFDKEEPDKSHTSNNLAKVVQRDRPANVPPPAVLLAWLPKVFSALGAEARQPNADVFVGISVLQVYRVSAHIIAGRAARWKRDSILAQSMKIGAAGRSGGMKLTTLDKGESRKEDQAAEEVIASWTRFSHVLNAAIIRAKTQKPPMALSSQLSARIATGLDVVTAAHICALCGLRRNERVMGIDVNVSDTFGEFWVEHWGHKDCADIWYGFDKLLDQR